MSDDLATRLAAMQELADNTPLPETTRDEFPDPLAGIEDDDYQAIVEGFEVRDDYENHPDVVSLKTKVTIQHHPVHGGRELEIFHWDILNENQLPYLKDHFFKLGVDPLILTEVQNGSGTFETLLDTPVLIGVYTGKGINKKTGQPYRNVVVRQRLDGVSANGSDLGMGQEQIDSFNGPINEQTAPAGGTWPTEKTASKPDNCSCTDPTNGDFDPECGVAGHGIPF